MPAMPRFPHTVPTKDITMIWHNSLDNFIRGKYKMLSSLRPIYPLIHEQNKTKTLKH